MPNSTAAPRPPHTSLTDDFAARLAATRKLSTDLVAGLSDADATVQSMPDASPAKWHLAHTSWFFETFVLRDHVPGYRGFDARWAYLFNSYYDAEGARHPRLQRGLLTRPTLAEVLAYRAHVDAALAAAMPALVERCPDRLELGVQHEQQHQELLLTDIKHLFAANPLAPAAWPAPARAKTAPVAALNWIAGPAGLVEIGHDGRGFGFDCEAPMHRHYLAPHALADRTITNAEWAGFIADHGYATTSLWLADGWSWVRDNAVAAPLYWREGADGWETFTLAGWTRVDPAAPVTHISFYEADAYANWAGARLPTEHEWEAAARRFDSTSGVQLDVAGPVAPQPAASEGGLTALFGDVWEWTASAYRPYPGFRAAAGAIGEYNGKFMTGQYVLRGGSCATPRGHLRASYRNFFYPHQRWQFTGVRLAKDL